jgi:hypothetical protein
MNPSEYMPPIKACLGLHPLANRTDCLDALAVHRRAVARGAGADTHEGVALASRTAALRELVGMAPTSSLEDVLHAVGGLVLDASVDQRQARDRQLGDEQLVLL